MSASLYNYLYLRCLFPSNKTSYSIKTNIVLRWQLSAFHITVVDDGIFEQYFARFSFSHMRNIISTHARKENSVRNSYTSSEFYYRTLLILFVLYVFRIQYVSVLVRKWRYSIVFDRRQSARDISTSKIVISMPVRLNGEPLPSTCVRFPFFL